MLKPINNFILVRPTKSEVGVIQLPDNKEKPEWGEVVASGDHEVIKAGNKVLFKKYAPDEVEVEGEKLLMISDVDIMAINE